MATPETDLKKRVQWDPNLKGLIGSIDKAGESLVTTTDAWQKRAERTYLKTYKELIEKVGNAAAAPSAAVDKATESVLKGFDKFFAEAKEATKPFSDFMGSTLNGTGVAGNPLGPLAGLGALATSLLNSVSPGYGDKVNGSIKNLQLERLADLPTQLFSGLDHLINAVDNLLAIPVALVAEIYYGYMALMKSISNFISKVMNGLIEKLFNFLDELIGLKAILALLNQISTLANQIGGIAGTFLGANTITGFTQQLTLYTRQIGGIISSPQNFVFSLLPADVNATINLIQSPQNIINAYLPPQLTQAFATIQNMAGFGFNGNMGYGFESVLKGFQGGVLRSIVTNYSAQFSVLSPVLAGTGTRPKSYTPKAIAQYNEAYDKATKGTNQPQYQQSQTP